MPNWNLAEKRGFGLTGGFWKGFGVVLIEAPIYLVTSTLFNHFRAEYDADIFPASLDEQEKHFLWQYAGHPWTIWWTISSEEVAFALALLLETKAIVITHNGVSERSTLKIFYQDKWVEHYHFGWDAYDDSNEKIGDRDWGIGYWDLEVTYEYFVSQSTLQRSGQPLTATVSLLVIYEEAV